MESWIESVFEQQCHLRDLFGADWEDVMRVIGFFGWHGWMA